MSVAPGYCPAQPMGAAFGAADEFAQPTDTVFATLANLCDNRPAG
jgi:hypothetical protein